MQPAVASALVLAAASLLVGLLTYRNNRAGQNATNVIESKKVDLEEFREVQTRNEKALERADKEREADRARIERLEEALMEERQAREAADERAAAAETRAQRAEQRAERLERRVTQLEQVLRDHDMSVPPPLPDSKES